MEVLTRGPNRSNARHSTCHKLLCCTCGYILLIGHRRVALYVSSLGALYATQLHLGLGGCRWLVHGPGDDFSHQSSGNERMKVATAALAALALVSPASGVAVGRIWRPLRPLFGMGAAPAKAGAVAGVPCVHGWMTPIEKLVTLAPSMTLSEAACALREGRVSGAPVVEGKRLLGILSQKDLLYYLVQCCWPSARPARDERPSLALHARVHDAAQPLLVCDDALRARAARREPDARSASSIVLSSRAGLSARGCRVGRDARLTTVTPDTTMKDAASLLIERKISRLPVVDRSGSLVGLLSTSDVMDVVANCVEDEENGCCVF